MAGIKGFQAERRRALKQKARFRRTAPSLT
jgi:hypothetical protein